MLTALEAVVEGLDREPVLRYLKSALSPLDPAACDRLENYVITWGLGGKAWREPFDRHPRGLGLPWELEDEAALEDLNRSRETGVLPLVRMQTTMAGARNTLEQLEALYAFLEEIRAPQRLEDLATAFEAAGDRQGHPGAGAALGYSGGGYGADGGPFLGETVRDLDGFTRLFRLLLSQYQVGTIPPDSGQRYGGRRGCHAAAGGPICIPPGGSGGIPAPGRDGRHGPYGAGAENADGFGPAPSRRTCTGSWSRKRRGFMPWQGAPPGSFASPAAQGNRLPSFGGWHRCWAGRRSRSIFHRRTGLPTFGMPGPGWQARARSLQRWEEAWRQVRAGAGYTLGVLTPETVRGLYGERLRLSASQVDKAASCRFAYFMRYGLRARERKEITVDPAEFGTFVHYILEHTARDVCEAGGFSRVSLERTQELAMEYAGRYRREYFAGLGERTSRQDYLLERNLQELRAVVRELWEELAQSRFQPAGFEVQFGPGGAMPPVEIPGGAMPAQLRGFVDRLDLYERDGQTYVRVVDYKKPVGRTLTTAMC